jgi:hypothetical protein
MINRFILTRLAVNTLSVTIKKPRLKLRSADRRPLSRIVFFSNLLRSWAKRLK